VMGMPEPEHTYLAGAPLCKNGTAPTAPKSAIRPKG
jgi:hypothetical protein